MRLSERRWGTGTRPALLLHGFTGDSHAFDGLRPWLGKALVAISLDLPGHGRSPLTASSGRAGYEETLEALERRLIELGEPAELIGYSQGARLALAVALRRPRCVRRLVLVSGSPGLRRRRARRARRLADEALAQRLERGGVEPFMRRWEALPLFEGLRRLPPAQRQELSAARRRCSAQGLAAALRAFGTGVQPSCWEGLPGLRVPTLLVTGARDAKFTAIAVEMAAQLPLGWRCTLEGVWHAPHLEAPAALCAELLRFLQSPWSEEDVTPELLEEVA